MADRIHSFVQRTLLCFSLGLAANCLIDPYNAADPSSQAFVEYNLLRCLTGGQCTGPAPLVPVFTEQWESGINGAVWKTWGNPLPFIQTGMGISGSDVIDPNGDGTYTSGVTSYQNFDLTKPTRFEYKLFTYSNNTVWEYSEVGFGNQTAAGYSGTGAQPGFAVFIRVEPATADTFPLQIRYKAGSDLFTEPYVPANDDNVWRTYAFEINQDGTVSFYKDGVHKFTSTVTLSGKTAQPVVVAARSVNTVTLIDDVVVEQ